MAKLPCRVLIGIRRGLTLREIADETGLSLVTVKRIAAYHACSFLLERQQIIATMGPPEGRLRRVL